MTTMQDMFDLNTAIDQLKAVANKDYNFDVSASELETNIHIFAQTEGYPEIVQDAYIEFNRKVKQELQTMIDNLIDKRDEMTMSILQSNYQTMNDIHSETADNVLEHQKEVDKAYEKLNQLTAELRCDGLDCDTCMLPDCSRTKKKKQK